MRQDRFLIGILAGIVILAVAAIALFFVRQNAQTYLPEDTPDGVVHNFIFALQQDDYERAHGYLANDPDKPTLAEFQQFYAKPYTGVDGIGIQVIATDILEGTERSAVVALKITHTNSDPLSPSYSNIDTAFLIWDGAAWKIQTMPYPFFNWDWYEDIQSDFRG